MSFEICFDYFVMVAPLGGSSDTPGTHGGASIAEIYEF